MFHKPPRGFSRVDLPEPQGTVPGSGKSKLSIGGDDDVGDEVVMSAKGTLSVATGVVLWFIGLGAADEGPDHDRFVPGRREDQGWVFLGSGDRCYPVVVASESSAES